MFPPAAESRGSARQRKGVAYSAELDEGAACDSMYIGSFISSMSSCIVSGSSIDETTARISSELKRKAPSTAACSLMSPSKASMRGTVRVSSRRQSSCESTSADVGGRCQKAAQLASISSDRRCSCGWPAKRPVATSASTSASGRTRAASASASASPVGVCALVVDASAVDVPAGACSFAPVGGEGDGAAAPAAAGRPGGEASLAFGGEASLAFGEASLTHILSRSSLTYIRSLAVTSVSALSSASASAWSSARSSRSCAASSRCLGVGSKPLGSRAGWTARSRSRVASRNLEACCPNHAQNLAVVSASSDCSGISSSASRDSGLLSASRDSYLSRAGGERPGAGEGRSRRALDA